MSKNLLVEILLYMSLLFWTCLSCLQIRNLKAVSNQFLYCFKVIRQSLNSLVLKIAIGLSKTEEAINLYKILSSNQLINQNKL